MAEDVRGLPDAEADIVEDNLDDEEASYIEPEKDTVNDEPEAAFVVEDQLLQPAQVLAGPMLITDEMEKADDVDGFGNYVVGRPERVLDEVGNNDKEEDEFHAFQPMLFVRSSQPQAERASLQRRKARKRPKKKRKRLRKRTRNKLDRDLAYDVVTEFTYEYYDLDGDNASAASPATAVVLRESVGAGERSRLAADGGYGNSSGYLANGTRYEQTVVDGGDGEDGEDVPNDEDVTASNVVTSSPIDGISSSTQSTTHGVSHPFNTSMPVHAMTTTASAVRFQQSVALRLHPAWPHERLKSQKQGQLFYSRGK